MRQCKKCGKQIDPDDLFCTACGEPIEEGQIERETKEDVKMKAEEEERAKIEKERLEKKKAQEEERARKEAERTVKEDIVTPAKSQSSILIDKSSKMKTAVVILSVLLGIFFLGAVGLGYMWSAANNDLKETESQLTTKTTELGNLQSDLSAVNTAISGLESQITSLQQAKTSLEQENNSLQNSLDAIEELFPPREFYSEQELRNWLQSNGISNRAPSTNAENWYLNALELQKDALNDGYIVSVDYDTVGELYGVFCVTTINGYIYYWDPETDDVFQETDLVPGG